jgi:hypothetical protein
MARFDAEFVVTPPQILDKGMTTDHDRRGPVRSKTAHRPQPRLEPAVITLDPVVRILARVMQHPREEVVHNPQQRCSQIWGDLSWTFTARQHHLEELVGRRDVASFRHVHVDDLTVLVDGSVHVPPHTGNLHRGFIDEPAVAETVTARPRSVDDQRGEALTHR